MNKAKEVREALGLTTTVAGQIILGIRENKKAYDTWARMEKNGKWSSAVDQYFKIFIALKMCRDFKTNGAGRALDIVLDMLTDDEEEDT